jgi:hypothetical protein
LTQLTHQTFPYLEHLRINHMHISLINHNADLCRKVFSNIFPRLITCYLFQWEKIMNIQGWTYSLVRSLTRKSIRKSANHCLNALCVATSFNFGRATIENAF